MNFKKCLYLKKAVQVSFVLFVSILFFSCENFLNGSNLKQSLNETIDYEKAAEVTVNFENDPASGNISPSGQSKVKSGYYFDVSFAENSDSHLFLKWVVLKNDKEFTEGVSIKNPFALKTEIKVPAVEGIVVKALTVKRIAVSGEPSPKYDSNGVSRDRSITAQFTKAPSKNSFIFTEDEIPEGAVKKVNDKGEIWAYTLDKLTYLKNISITNSDDISIADHFLEPVVDGSLLTVAVNKGNPIQLENGSTFKIIKVSLSKNICDSEGISMGSDKSWKYQITESTDEKATITLSSVYQEGSVYLAGTRDYNIGQKITLAFTESSDYQFIKWEYDPDIIYIEDGEVSNPSTYAVVKEKTTEENPSEIRAVCAPRLRTIDSEFKPLTDNTVTSVGRNSTIKIKFNKSLPSDEENLKQLQNITVTIGGTDIRSSFLSPSLENDTITFVADRSNLLEVSRGQTKTVTVFIPSDFYYINENGIKVSYGGTGKSFNYVIDHTTETKSDITFTSTAGSGSYLSDSGTVYFSLNESADLKYSLESDYVFDRWEVSSSDPLFNSDNIVIDDVKAISTKIHVYEAYAGVVVKAVCHKLFKVSIEPEYMSSGKSCDSLVTFKFNKNVNQNSIIQTNSEGKKVLKNIQICNPNNTSESYESYFDITDYSSKNFTLTLKPNYKIRNLVPEKSDLANIKIIFDSAKITDTEGYSLNFDDYYIYRINNDMESFAPELNYFNLVKPVYEKDKETGNYTELASGDKRSDASFYTTYHVGKKLYYKYSVSDSGSGLKSFSIEEELIKTIEAVDTSIVSEKYVFDFPLINGHVSEEYTKDSYIEYKLKSEMDGMVKLTFTFEDYAGNKNQFLYYVIKDAKISTAVIKPSAVSISGTSRYVDGNAVSAQIKVTETGIKQLNSFKADENNEVTTTLDYSAIKKTYYSTKYDNISVKLFFGYSKDSITNECEEISSRKFSFKRDVFKDAFIKIEAYDSVGNKAEVIRVIPKKLNIGNIGDDSASTKKLYINDIEEEALKSQEYGAMNFGYMYFYSYQESADSDVLYYIYPYTLPTNIKTKNDNVYFSDTGWSCDKYTPDGVYKFYVLPWFEYSENYYCGTLSDPYIFYHNVDGPVSPKEPSFPSDITVSFDTAVDNSGYRTVNVSLPPEFTKTSGFEYGVVYYSDLDKTANCYSDSFTFNIESAKHIVSGTKIVFSNNYVFNLYAKDSTGKVFISSINKKVTVPGDNTAPVILNSRARYGLNVASSPQAFYLSCFDLTLFINRPFDNVGMYKNSNGLVEIDAYLIKKEEENTATNEITREMLNQYKKITVTYDDSLDYKTMIPVFFDDLPESYYYCVLDLKDNNLPVSNSSLVSFSCSNILNPVALDITVKEETNSYICNYDQSYKGGTVCYIQDSYWRLLSMHDIVYKNEYSLAKTTVNGNFVRFIFNAGVYEKGAKSCLISFLSPEYEVKKQNDPSFELKQKSVVASLGNSFLVFYDAPCFVHTLAYPTKSIADIEKIKNKGNLSSEIPVWESKGREYGLKLLNKSWEAGSCSYYVPVEEIPEGFSYVTVFRFADGTAVMSDVKTR